MMDVLSRRGFIGAGAVAAGVFVLPTPAWAVGAIKHYILVGLRPGTDALILDRWYIRFHSQEVRRAVRAWQRTYLSYRSYDVPAEADRYKVWRGRMTEIQFDSIDDFRESRVNNIYGQDMMTPPPGGWLGAGFSTETITVPVNPQEVYLKGNAPIKETPYLRWIVFVKFPAGVVTADAEKWFLDVHVKELAKLPGLRRFVGYRSVASSPDFPRAMELWFDDYGTWRKSFLGAPLKLTPPPWGGTFPFYDIRSMFVGENPDVDFINDRRVIP